MHFDDKDYTLGLGVREKMLRLDYAYVNPDFDTWERILTACSSETPWKNPKTWVHIHKF